MDRFAIIGLVGVAMAALTGCFEEPRPAYETVPAETQVYLKDAGLEELSVEQVLRQGMIFLGDSEHGHFAKLADCVQTLEPASLDYLNLDYNALTNVAALTEFTGLKWLRLNHNRLETLPDLSRLTSLRRLYLRGNRLAAIPATLCTEALPELDAVDFSDNPQLTVIPEGFAARKGLHHLNFSNTGIVELPADLSAWKSLRSLQLGGLKLKSFEELERIREALPDTRIVF